MSASRSKKEYGIGVGQILLDERAGGPRHGELPLHLVQHGPGARLLEAAVQAGDDRRHADEGDRDEVVPRGTRRRLGEERGGPARVIVRVAVEVGAGDQPPVVLLPGDLSLFPRQAVDLVGEAADAVEALLPPLPPGDRRPEARGHLRQFPGQELAVAVEREGERDHGHPPVPQHLHQRLGEAAIPLRDGDDLAEIVPADHAVDPLDPAAAVSREPVRLGAPEVIRGEVRRDEHVVQVDGDAPRREEDLDGNGGGEADARRGISPG